MARLKISEIKNNPNNPRLIKDDNFKKLVQSLKQLPIMLEKRPVLIDEDNIIIGGNMRHKAAKDAGLKEIPVEYFTREDAEQNNIEAKKLDSDYVDRTYEQQRQEMIIKDNVSGGEWDWDMLANEWDSEPLDDWGVDLPEDWLEQEPEIEEDEAPEVSSEPPVSQLGVVYQLGRHRVMCGDSTDFEAIMDLLEGAEPDSIVTDPPYGIGIDGQKKSMNKNPKHNRKEHEFRNWDKERPSEKQFEIIDELGLKTVIWGGNYFADMLPATRGWLYWDKGQNGLTMSDGELAWTNQSKPLRAVTCNRANLGETQHPTQKPVQVMQFSLDYIDAKVCLDLFLGSGSTLIACEQTDRTCYGMELDPKYVDVIRKRHHKFVTGSEEGWEDATRAI